MRQPWVGDVRCEYTFIYYCKIQGQTGGLVCPNNFEKYGFSYGKNLNLYGDNNTQLSVFAVLSIKICVTGKQFLHFQCQLLKLAK